MAIITQYYTPNQEFELSSVNQLRSDSEWRWNGRTLTAFVDQDGKQYGVENYNQHLSATFPGMEASISGRWELNKLPIWLSVISNDSDPEGAGGVLSVHWYKTRIDGVYGDTCLPMSDPQFGDFTINNIEKEKNERYYGSNLSISLKAEDNFIPVLFKYYYDGAPAWIIVENPTDVLKIESWGSGGHHGWSQPLSVVAEFQRGILRYYSGKGV